MEYTVLFSVLLLSLFLSAEGERKVKVRVEGSGEDFPGILIEIREPRKVVTASGDTVDGFKVSREIRVHNLSGVSTLLSSPADIAKKFLNAKVSNKLLVEFRDNNRDRIEGGAKVANWIKAKFLPGTQLNQNPREVHRPKLHLNFVKIPLQPIIEIPHDEDEEESAGIQDAMDKEDGIYTDEQQSGPIPLDRSVAQR